MAAREKDLQASITLVSEESDHMISRTALMWVVSGQLSHQCIEPYERDHYAQHGFERVRARAVAIHAQPRRGSYRDDEGAPEGGELELSDGKRLPFDRLLIACGSVPRKGPWPGSDLLGVGHFVTLQDLEWLEGELHGGAGHGGPPPRADHHLKDGGASAYARRALAREKRGGPPSHPVVIGGGLIGIEAVEVFHAAGLHPRFFIREEWFWPMAIDQVESTWISDRMREGGVHMHLGENVKTLTGADALQKVKTDQGEYEADLCVIAIGVVPNTAWLRESSVELDERGGIVVDELQRTNLAGVYAAGDCASVLWFNDRRMPEQLWYTGRDQGRVAGINMTGGRESYARGTWYNSAKLFDIEYTTAGLVNMKQPDEREW
ncbi:MAG: FAD-dependent oxidoreductase, partial [Myxococcota bacterium]